MSEGNAFLLTVPCQDYRQHCLVIIHARYEAIQGSSHMLKFS